jgi:dedicator of cytokinesis protein 3
MKVQCVKLIAQNFIFISNLKDIIDLKLHKNIVAGVYYNTNCVRKFIYDRPVQRAPFDPNNEFKSLWIERTCCTIEHQLPGVLRMFEVVATQVSQVSPIEHACETIENMNNELSKLISNFTIEGKNESKISLLSMRLQVIKF